MSGSKRPWTLMDWVYLALAALLSAGGFALAYAIAQVQGLSTAICVALGLGVALLLVPVFTVGLRSLVKTRVSILASILSILVGLLVGLALLLLINPKHAFSGFGQIITTALASPEKMAKMLYQAAPLMMCGLSVAFAFKTGLFNIGATGQYTMGAFLSLTAVIQWGLPWYAALVLGMVGGAVVGAIPGICKAMFNVNEVITGIMFNWITMFLVNMLIGNMPQMISNSWGISRVKDRTVLLTDAAFAEFNPNATLPKGGLDQLMGSNYINIGIFIAIGIALVVWLVLQKTTFGYELKACGYNRHASQYAGINASRNIVLSMTLAGALAGIGGGLYFLSGAAQYTLLKQLLPTGFNGIPVALLASNHPIGVLFSALFISYIQVGGDALQPHFIKENIEIIISSIIYLSAFSLLMKDWIGKQLMRVFSGKRRGDEALPEDGAGDGARPPFPDGAQPNSGGEGAGQ